MARRLLAVECSANDSPVSCGAAGALCPRLWSRYIERHIERYMERYIERCIERYIEQCIERCIERAIRVTSCGSLLLDPLAIWSASSSLKCGRPVGPIHLLCISRRIKIELRTLDIWSVPGKKSTYTTIDWVAYRSAWFRAEAARGLSPIPLVPLAGREIGNPIGCRV